MRLVKNIWLTFKNSSFWKSVATLSAGQVIALLINIFSIPIVSRIYSKEAFGDFAILTSTATIIIGCIGLGLGSAIMVPNSDEESRKIFVNIYSLQGFLALIFSIILILIEPIYKFSFRLPYIITIVIMFFYIILTVLSSLMGVYINRLKMDNVLFINPLIGAIVTILFKIPLGIIGFDSTGMYLSILVSLIIVNGHMIKKNNPFKEVPSIKDTIQIFKKYKDFVIFQYPSNLIGTVSAQLPNQVLAENYGTVALSDYDMSNRAVGGPSNLIASPIQTIYFRTVSQSYRNDEDIADFTFSLVAKLMLVGAIPIISLLAFGEEIFAFVLGVKWSFAGNLASILSLNYLFNFCYNCITYCRVAIQKQKINLITSVIHLIIILGSIFIGIRIIGTFEGTIFCYAVFNSIYNIFNIIITFYCLQKYVFKFLIFSVIYCLTCIGISFLLRMIFL